MPHAPDPFAVGITNDVSAALFLLLREDLASPAQFVCPTTEEIPDDFDGSGDGRFERHAVVGIGGDDIFTSQHAPLTVELSPARRSDTILLPTDDAR